ncbi:MAG TPA: hypothetical protein DCE23_05630 [Firmicutes bacterium]|nr:hypothetical protein [Bacillota bacterium]
MAIFQHKNFIDTYENKIKKIREEYYRNKVNKSSVLNIDLTLIATIISLFLLIIFGFNLTGFIVAFIGSIVINLIFVFTSRMLGIDSGSNYLREIKRLGYLNIASYEKSLRKYVTGPGGYYDILLEELKKQYNLTDQVRKIEGAKGESYFIWLNSNQDSINLLNERTTDKPQVISIRMNNIRYFRIDHKTRTILLKTDIEFYRFQMSALDIFNEILKNKRFDNLINFEPEQYISDFEIFIHNFEQKINNKGNRKSYDEYEKEFSKLVLYIIMYIVGAGLIVCAFDNLILKIAEMLVLILLSYSFASLLNTKKYSTNNQKDMLHIMNSDEECIERFNELKIALNIREDYDIVYSKDNASYYTWVANGYFHVFLNVIYTSVIYMAVKVSDVSYYRKTSSGCVVKLKDKTLEFRRDAKNVFDKILPNKDYDWLKGYQQK